jgi:hypothetical protein
MTAMTYHSITYRTEKEHERRQRKLMVRNHTQQMTLPTEFCAGDSLVLIQRAVSVKLVKLIIPLGGFLVRHTCFSIIAVILLFKEFFYLRRDSVHVGRAVAQAVSRWLPTAAARVHVRAALGVCGGQSGFGAGFLRVLRFPLPISPSP